MPISHPNPIRSAPAGFSLVELSVVLIILGLLVGGILGGRSLIQAAELRSITADAEMFRTAIYNFEQRYNARPGDLPNATAYWGSRSDCSPYPTAVPAATHPKPALPACNGNGDGEVIGNGHADNAETLYAWHHLGNAELIPGRYTGIPVGSSGSGLHHPGLNCPPSRYSSSICWAFMTPDPIRVLPSGTPHAWYGGYYDNHYGNSLVLGGQTTRFPVGPFIPPQDIWNLDTKFDDGKPDKGLLVGTVTPGTEGCYATVGGVLEYNVTSSTGSCAMIFNFRM